MGNVEECSTLIVQVEDTGARGWLAPSYDVGASAVVFRLKIATPYPDTPLTFLPGWLLVLIFPTAPVPNVRR